MMIGFHMQSHQEATLRCLFPAGPIHPNGTGPADPVRNGTVRHHLFGVILLSNPQSFAATGSRRRQQQQQQQQQQPQQLQDN